MVCYQDEKITGQIIAAAIEVHKVLGPGLLESAYKACLLVELAERGLKYSQELIIPINYKNHRIDCGFRIDVLVEDRVIVELKSVEVLLPVHKSQVITYLRLQNKQVGLLINFNVPLLKQGIKRCVLNADEYEEDEQLCWKQF